MFATETCNEFKPTQQVAPSYTGSGNRCGHDPQNPAWHNNRLKRTSSQLLC